jgi:hypothetical protein
MVGGTLPCALRELAHFLFPQINDVKGLGSQHSIRYPPPSRECRGGPHRALCSGRYAAWTEPYNSGAEVTLSGGSGCTPGGRLWDNPGMRRALPNAPKPTRTGRTKLTTNIPEPLITEGEAASILRVSLTSLRRWRRQGSGPVYRKLGRTVRYRPNDLSDFVAVSRRTSTMDGRAMASSPRAS